jgi:hypothetical protein
MSWQHVLVLKGTAPAQQLRGPALEKPLSYTESRD